MKPKSTLRSRLLPFISTLALALATPSAYSETVTYNTAGNFTWICPPGVTSVQVECWGGGGAGGGAKKTGSANAGGGGGGGGAYAIRTSVPVTAGSSYVITIPAAATCPTTFVNDERFNGGTVTFQGDGGITVTAAGGTGGQSKVAAASILTGSGGTGGTAGASVGDIIWVGGNGVANTTSNGGPGGAGASDLAAGNNATAATSTAGATTTGSDAAHNGGAGGGGRTAENNGNIGTAPGGGGGGAKVTTASATRTGGAGGLGRMILTFTAPLNVKANNTDDLNLPSSWTTGVPIGYLAEWDATVAGANTTSLGADLTFSGIRIWNPGGLVTINAGNALTLGSAAVDLDLSAATQDLTLNCDVALGAANVWDVQSGRTLTLGGVLSGSAAVTKQGAGSAIISGSNHSTAATSVTAGSLVYGVGSTFSPGGIGGVAGKLTVNGASAEANLQGAYTATGNGDAYFEIRGGGLLNFSGTANVSGGGGIRIGESSAGTMNMTAGTLNAVMNSGSNLVVGRSAGANGTLNLSGGTINITNAGGLAVANVAGNSGVVNISGTGQLVVNSTGNSSLGPGTATINLNTGGTFTLGANLVASGTSTINFDGGTLKAGRPSTASLPTSLTAVNILAGGAIIDTNGFAITAPEPLLSGVVGDGGLTKTGLNALTLGGANTYTGTTQVNAGNLKFSTAAANVSDVVVATGAGAGARVDSLDAQFITATDLTLNNSSTLVIDYGSTAPSTTVAPLAVDNLIVGTGLSLLLEGDMLSTLAVSQSYPLVTWTTSGPINGTAFTGVLNNRLAGTFSVSANTLFFTVTANAVGAISWNTGNGVWDTTTPNWVDFNLAPTTYIDTLDDVLFGDALGASGNPVVTLNTTVSPSTVKMNSTGHDYTISGTGAISGSTDLTLDAANTRTLTLVNDNTYTGVTAIVGGTLSLGDGGAGGSLNPASTISIGTGATFAVNQNDTVTQGTEFSGAAISGAGGFVQAGAGTTILDAVNTYTGTTDINGGVLQAGFTNTGKGLGTGAVSIGSGSDLVLDVTNTVASSTVTVGNTFTGTGLLKFQFVASTNPRNVQTPNATGFGGTIQLSSLGVTGDKWNASGVGAISGSVIVDDGNTLYLPNGTPSFSGGIILTGTGNSEGRGALRLGNATLGGNISLTGDSTINLDNAAAVLTGNIGSGAAGTQTLTLGATGSTGGTLSGVIGGGTGTLNLSTTAGTYTLTNANTYTGTTTIEVGTLQLGDGTTDNDGTIVGAGGVTNNGKLTYNRFGSSTASYDISGTGGLSKTGAGTQTLTGTLSYAGTTVVNNGTLVISGATNTGSGALQVGFTTGPSTLTIATGGSFTTTGGLTLGSGVGGHTLNVQSGATLSVASITNNWGTDYHVDGILTATGNWSVSTNTGIRVFDGAGTISAAALNYGNASTGINYTGTGSINLAGAVTVSSNNANGNPSYTQTSGTLNANSMLLGENQANTAGSRTFNLNGGRVNLGSGGIAANGTTTANRVINLGAGTLGASADWSNSLAVTLTDASTGCTVNTLDSVDNTTARNIAFSGGVGGTGALTKAGTGTLTLTGALTYAGDTTVGEGTLSVGGINPSNESSTVTIADTGATLDLNFSGTQVVDKLFIGNTQMAAKEYKAVGSMATGTELAQLSGTGTLTVSTGPVGGYSTWAATNAPTTGNDPNADEDSDGVANGVEYVVGGTIATNDLDKLPGISTTPGGDMVFTFKRDQDSIDGSTTVEIEVGTTLGAWPDTYPVPDGAVVADPGVTVEKGSPTGFDTITLTVEQDPDAAKFARLKVMVTP